MMKILGTFKVVPDLEQLAEEDWQADDQHRVDTSFIKTIWNCFDESALEMMLRLSDQSEGLGVKVQLDAVNVWHSCYENYFKTLYALGFERSVWIEWEAERHYQPEMTAGLLSEYVRQEGKQDLLLMGRQSADDDNSKTPLLVAENLGWPCITQVIKVALTDDTQVEVTNMTDQGLCTQKVKLPCVLVIGDAPGGYLRVPTLKDRMKKGKRPIERYQASQWETKAQIVQLDTTTELISMEPVCQSREGLLIEGETAAEKAGVLYQTYLKGRLKGI